MIEDRDLQSIQQARQLLVRASRAQKALEEFSQDQVDKVIDAMAAAARQDSERLARLAHEETGYGNPHHKVLKNLFAAERVYNYIRPLKTAGIIRDDRENGVIEIASPVGVIAAIIPSTNPTSTAIYKCLISIKARNAIVCSPHPAAVRCIQETIRVVYEAARRAGAPEDCMLCMDLPTLEGTQELMRHELTALILATGGMGLVKAAYSSGKPAYGVGPGNVPAYVDRTADVEKATRDILYGKCFDNGTLCSSEQSLVADKPVADQILDALKRNGAHVCNDLEKQQLERLVFTPQKTLNTAIVGKPAPEIAKMAGFTVGHQIRALVAQAEGVGRDHPLSVEKLSPVLAFYVEDGWEAGCRRCIEILSFGGLGHTLAVHATDRHVIEQFGLRKPAFRICVNTPAAIGAIGYTTSLVPSMTLGCGTIGGNITTDNISPLHLLNIKRLAFETNPIDHSRARSLPAAALNQPAAANVAAKPAAVSAGSTVQSRDVIRQVVEEFLRRRQSSSPMASQSLFVEKKTEDAPRPITEPLKPPRPAPVDFVSEEDVRVAVRKGEKIPVNSKTIITPAARDLGEEKKVFAWNQSEPRTQ